MFKPGSHTIFLNYTCHTLYLESNGNKIVNTDRFHFAMNGQWSENKSDIHSISTESDLINWFRGLLNHLKKERLFSIKVSLIMDLEGIEPSTS